MPARKSKKKKKRKKSGRKEKRKVTEGNRVKRRSKPQTSSNFEGVKLGGNE